MGITPNGWRQNLYTLGVFALERGHDVRTQAAWIIVDGKIWSLPYMHTGDGVHLYTGYGVLMTCMTFLYKSLYLFNNSQHTMRIS